jgi:CBS-domain-containing membrane protein
MSTDLVTVTPDVTIAEALLLMSQRQVHNIPVVDEKDNFVGLFSLRRLAHDLLPTAARVDVESFHMDLAFLSDDSDEFLRRLHEIGRKPVSELLEKKKKLRFCKPDTSIPRMLQLLTENPTSLPVVVVQGKHQKVVGMVSTWDVLTKVAVKLVQDSPPDAPDGMEEQSGNDETGEEG